MVKITKTTPTQAAEINDSCACCGRRNLTRSPYMRVRWLWCRDCAAHVDPRWLLKPLERTWFAQHGTACPYQVAEV